MSEPLYKLKGEFFKTLGHPARIRILELLSTHDRSVGELLPEIGIESSNLSQQLYSSTQAAGSRDQAGAAVKFSATPSSRLTVTTSLPTSSVPR